MESKWRHDVTWKSGCFSAPERDDISKNADVLQLSDIDNLIRHYFINTECSSIWFVLSGDNELPAYGISQGS